MNSLLALGYGVVLEVSLGGSVGRRETVHESEKIVARTDKAYL